MSGVYYNDNRDLKDYFKWDFEKFKQVKKDINFIIEEHRKDKKSFFKNFLKNAKVNDNES